MPAQNKNIAIVVIVLAVIAIGVGAFVFISGRPGSQSAQNEQAAATQTSEVATAAGSDSAAAPAPAAQTQTPPAGTSAAPGTFGGVEIKPGNPVVAKVDGREITRVDVYNYIRTLPENIQQLPATTVYPLAMEQVVNTRLIQNKAEEVIKPDDPAVQEQMALAMQQIVRNVYVQKTVDGKITEDKLKKAYDEYVKKAGNAEERRAFHILVDSEAKANEVISKLDGGADFQALVKEYAAGNDQNGGDLGWFTKEEMVPEFANAAFSVDKGKYNKEPIKTQFGWHVIYVQDARKRKPAEFEAVKPFLQVQLRREILDELISDWRKGAKIEQFDINGEPVVPGTAEKSVN